MNNLANGWFYLSIAILFGVLATTSLKLSHGLTKFVPIVILTISYCISFIGLTLAMDYIELSTVYAVWSGAGTALVWLISVMYLKEKTSIRNFLFLALIITGVIGIHLSDGLP